MNSTVNQNLTILVEFLLNDHVFLISYFFLFSDKDLDERAITNQWMNVLLEFIQSSAEPPDGRTEKLRVT